MGEDSGLEKQEFTVKKDGKPAYVLKVQFDKDGTLEVYVNKIVDGAPRQPRAYLLGFNSLQCNMFRRKGE
jgi:hypothetical protein